MHQPFVAHPQCEPTDPPARLDYHDIARLRQAALRVQKLYPGPVGDYLQRDLDSWQVVGLKFDSRGMVSRLIDAIMAAPLPDPPAKAA